MANRFTLDEGEIVDTKAGTVITPDRFNKIATDDEKADMERQMVAAGVMEQGDEEEAPARPAADTAADETADDPRSEWLVRAREVNPNVSDDALLEYYDRKHEKLPDKLPTLDAWLPRAKEANPSASETDLRDYWQKKYGARGAKEKDSTMGALARGAVTAAKQIPQLGAGLVAGAGAAIESVAGEGGIGTALKEWGAKKYEAAGKDIAADAKPTDSFTTAYEKASEGDLGALGDWLQYALGYAGIQAVEMLATGGLGMVAGKVALEQVAKTTAKKLVDKEAARIAEQTAGTLAAEEITRQATKNVAAKIGQTTALAATAVGMEGGEILGDTALQSAQEGRPLSGEELAKAFGATLAAGSLEFVGDKFGFDLMVGKSPLGKVAGEMTGLKGRAARTAIQGGVAAPVEGATEFAQTIVEEYGKGGDPLGDQSIREAIDAAAMGAVGGAAMGGTAGAIVPPQRNRISQIFDNRVDVDEAIRIANQALANDEEIDQEAQTRYEQAYQRQAERAARTGLINLSRTRPTEGVPILEGAQPATEPPIVVPTTLTPRAPKEPTPQDVIERERARVAQEGRPQITAEVEPDSPRFTEGPLQSAKDLAYPESERGALPSQEDLIYRQNVTPKKAGGDIPVVGSPPAATEPSIQVVSPPRPMERPKDPKDALAQERAKLLAQRQAAIDRANQFVESLKGVPRGTDFASLGLRSPTEPVKKEEVTPLKSAYERAYPTIEEAKQTAESKGFDLASSVFRDVAKAITGKTLIDEMTPIERQRFVNKLNAMERPRPKPDVPAQPKRDIPVQAGPQQTERLNDIEAAKTPRSTLVPEQNAEMLARAEKAQADLESGIEARPSILDFLRGKGGVQDQGGELSGMEPDKQLKPFQKKLINPKGLTLDEAAELAEEAGLIRSRDINELLTAIDRELRGGLNWYDEATTGPGALSRQRVEAAVHKILADKGRDVGKDVERIKELLLADQEFMGSPFAPKTEDDWQRLIAQATEQPLQPATPELETEATDEPSEPASPPLPDTEAAPTRPRPGDPVGNGWFAQPEYGKYRASYVQSTNAVMLEKRTETGKPSSFYVGTDGAFIDGATVVLNNPASRERLWNPPDEAAKQEALRILHEMGKLPLNDPQRAVLKQQLKDLVTGGSQPSESPTREDRIQAEREKLGIDDAAHEAATSPQNDLPEPSQAEKEAGVYKKGHLRLNGLDISIENPAGSERSGVDPDGKPWRQRMTAHYGYIRSINVNGTYFAPKGRDKEHIDIFIQVGTPEDYSGPVFVVDQNNPATGAFDEHKAVLGPATEAEAKALYLANYADDWTGFRSIKRFTFPEFKLWLRSGNKQKPAGIKRPVSVTERQKPEAPKETAGQQEIPVPPPTVGERPIIGREATPEEAPLFSKAAQDEPEQLAITADETPPGFNPPETKPTGESASVNQIQEPTTILANALRQAADQIEGKPIQDVGPKIGGARKDLAEKTGPKATVARPQDDRPGWRKRYTIGEVVSEGPDKGKWVVRDTKDTDFANRPRQVGPLFDTQAAAEQAIPLIAVSRTHRIYRQAEQWAIYRKIGDRKLVQVVADTFPTEAAAKQYMAVHAEEIIETKTNFGEEILPRPETVQRTGPDRRNGRNVTAQDFQETFALRAVEFGNWNNQDERQAVMNHAYDGLLDLAEILHIPPKAIGLNGELALAFGARGHGLSGARAHYERDYGVINLTKMKGAGSLAHEWFHSLDHYFGRQDTKATSERVPNERGDLVYTTSGVSTDFASYGFSQTSGVREAVREAYTNLIQTMFTKAEQYVEDAAKVERFVGEARADVAAELTKIRDTSYHALSKTLDTRLSKRKIEPATAEQLAAFDAIAEKLLAGELLETQYQSKDKRKLLSGRWTNDALEQLSAIYKAVRGRSGFGSGQIKGPLDDLRGAMQRYSQRLKLLADAQRGEEKTKHVPTSYAMEAKSIDQGRTEPYWMTHHEMAARAFSAYVEDRLKAQGRRSDFITYQTFGAVPTPWGWKKPYPEGTEREAINQAFERLFAILESKQTDQGTAMFSRGDFDSSDPRVFHPYMRQVIRTAPVIADTPLRLLDTSEEFPVELLEDIADQPYLRRLGQAITAAFEEIRAHLPEPLRDVRLLGLSPDSSYKGVHLGNLQLRAGGPPSNAIIVNPFKILRDARTTLSVFGRTRDEEIPMMAEDLTDTILHELVHQELPHDDTDPQDTRFQARLQDYRDLLHSTLRSFTNHFIGMLQEEDDGQPLIGHLGADLLRLSAFYRDASNPAYRPSGDGPQRAVSRSPSARSEEGPGGRSRSEGDVRAVRAGPSAEWIHQSDTRLQRSGSEPAELTFDVLNRPDFAGIRSTSPPTYTLPEITPLDHVVRTLSDKNIDLVRLVDTIKASRGAVADELNPVLKEELYMGRTAQRTQDFLTDELKPLVDAMRLNKVTMDELDEYLHARHAEEANAYLASINPDREDNQALSGMTNERAREILEAADPKMNRLAARVDAIIAKTRQLMVDYGLESAETVQAWADRYTFYVPLHREGFDETPGTGQGKNIRGSSVKTRTGSTRGVKNILAHVALAREKTIVRGEKMRPVIALAGLLLQNPNTEIANLAKPTVVTFTDPETGLETHVAGDVAGYHVPMISYLGPDGTVKHRPDPAYKGRENVVNFRLNGIDHAIVFNEENPRAMHMAQALKDLDVGQLNSVMSAAARVTRYLASVNTQFNPIFGVVNAIRDVQFAMLALSSTPLANKRSEIFAATWQAIRGIYQDARAVRKGEHPTSSTAQLWERFQHVGGPTGYRDLFRTSDERARSIEHMLDPDWWQKTAPGRFLTINGTLAKPASWMYEQGKGVFEWLSDYNLAMENAVRLGVFKAGLDEGLSDEQAASLAKNITVNFGRRGQITAQMGSLFAFFNASVQGTMRLAETLFKPGTFGVLTGAGKKIIAGGVTLGAVQAFALAMAGFDDDEPPDWVRARSVIVPIPGSGRYVSIPMPLGFNIIPNVGRLAAETLIYGKPLDRGYRFLSTMADALSPVGAGGSMAQVLAPTVADPIVALSENRDWTGRRIYREDFNSLHPTPGMSRAKETATPWSRGIAEVINYATGGTDYMPGLLSPTPDMLDYLVATATGGIGREVSKAVGVAGSLARGEDFPLHRVPLVGRFTGNIEETAAERDRFYRNVRDLNMLEAELKGRRQHGEDVTGFLQDHPEARLAKQAGQVEREVSHLQRRKRDLIKRGASSEQVRLVEMQIAARMKRLNQAVESQ